MFNIASFSHTDFK